MSYGAKLRRLRRRVILEILATLEPAPSSSEIMLEQLLDEQRVFGSDRDAVRTEITWLGEQGFVSVEDVGGVLFCTLLAGGAAIAAGKRVHPDIEKRPLKREA